MKNYLFNPNTHTVHIKGFCYHTKGLCPSYIAFNAEIEPSAYDGRAVGMCKLCQKEREKKLREIK